MAGLRRDHEHPSNPLRPGDWRAALMPSFTSQLTSPADDGTAKERSANLARRVRICGSARSALNASVC